MADNTTPAIPRKEGAFDPRNLSDWLKLALFVLQVTILIVVWVKSGTNNPPPMIPPSPFNYAAQSQPQPQHLILVVSSPGVPEYRATTTSTAK